MICTGGQVRYSFLEGHANRGVIESRPVPRIAIMKVDVPGKFLLTCRAWYMRKY